MFVWELSFCPKKYEKEKNNSELEYQENEKGSVVCKFGPESTGQ